VRRTTEPLYTIAGSHNCLGEPATNSDRKVNGFLLLLIASFAAHTISAEAASPLRTDSTHSADQTAKSKQNAPEIANIFLRGVSGARTLTGISGDPNLGVMSLNTADLLINPLIDLTIKSPLAIVHARKNSLLRLSIKPSIMRIDVLSGPHDVTVSVAGKTLAADAGEEIMISRQRMSSQEYMGIDGIGRRRLHFFSLPGDLHGVRSEVSIVSIMANLEYLKILGNPGNDVEKNIANRLVKSAACVQEAMKSHGTYTSQPASFGR
jgi:hypothetical protein